MAMDIVLILLISLSLIPVNLVSIKIQIAWNVQNRQVQKQVQNVRYVAKIIMQKMTFVSHATLLVEILDAEDPMPTIAAQCQIVKCVLLMAKSVSNVWKDFYWTKMNLNVWSVAIIVHPVNLDIFWIKQISVSLATTKCQDVLCVLKTSVQNANPNSQLLKIKKAVYAQIKEMFQPLMENHVNSA